MKRGDEFSLVIVLLQFTFHIKYVLVFNEYSNVRIIDFFKNAY